jgi:hypothetical protein
MIFLQIKEKHVIGVNLRLENFVHFGNKISFLYFYIFIYIQTYNRRVMTNPNTNTKLTTVKIIHDVYSKFKKISFDSNITLQKLVNRSLEKYTEDEQFRSEINNYNELQDSGSQF